MVWWSRCGGVVYGYADPTRALPSCSLRFIKFPQRNPLEATVEAMCMRVLALAFRTTPTAGLFSWTVLSRAVGTNDGGTGTRVV